MSDSINRDSLKALGPEALVDLLLEQAEGDDAFEKKLQWLTASGSAQKKSVKSRLSGLNYPLLTDIAKAFSAQGYSLCATLIFRSMVEEVLEQGISKYYKIAVGYLKKCDKLASSIDDWQFFQNHPSFCSELQEQHARKSALWKQWTPPPPEPSG